MALTLDSPFKEKPSNGCLSSIMVSDILTPSSSSIVGDYIGVESCLDLKENEGILTSPSTSCNKDSDHERFCSQRQLKRNDKWDRKKKEFPPPIPSLARTENLSSRMPWVLKRHHTSDGRLILSKEKVMRHEYFRAHRSNGRLILQLVPLDNYFLVPPFVNEEVDEHETRYISCEEEEEEEAGGGEVGVVVEEEGKDMQTTDNVSVESHDDVNDVSDDIEQDTLYKEARIPSMEAGIGGSGSAGKCYCFNSVRPTSTCMFHIPVPAMRPVHG